MVSRSSIRVGFWILSCLFVAAPAEAAFTVAPGYDLLETAQPTSFMNVPFQGVPLGTFDFGSGSVGVGSADTIVHRSGTATVAGPGPGTASAIPIELVALQLESVAPVDLGAGLNNYFITLQSARGGPVSAGQMDITFASQAGGTFSSFFDVFFDIRVGSLNGPIILSNDLVLSSNGTDWNRNPGANAVVIDGVNHNLNGSDQQADFWPGPITEQHPSGAVHSVVEATVPEPSSLIVWSLIGLSLGIAGWRRRKRIA